MPEPARGSQVGGFFALGSGKRALPGDLLVSRYSAYFAVITYLAFSFLKCKRYVSEVLYCAGDENCNSDSDDSNDSDDNDDDDVSCMRCVRSGGGETWTRR